MKTSMPLHHAPTAAEIAHKRQPGAPPYDVCSRCGRKMVKGGVECVRCACERLYGPWNGVVTAAPPIRQTFQPDAAPTGRSPGGH
jgi:hypothetical protein